MRSNQENDLASFYNLRISTSNESAATDGQYLSVAADSL